MKEEIREKIGRWSLERVRFLLSHIEGFIEDEEKELRARASAFVAESGIEKIERLFDSDPNDPGLPGHVLKSMSAFFESGLLIQRGPGQDTGNWWATDLFWRGNIFHLDLKDQVLTERLIPEMTPLQVHKAPAHKMLESLKLQFLVPNQESMAYLLRPTPTIAYILTANLGAPWSVDHLSHAQRLINKCFIY